MAATAAATPDTLHDIHFGSSFVLDSGRRAPNNIGDNDGNGEAGLVSLRCECRLYTRIHAVV